jgi:hypothetical protein
MEDFADNTIRDIAVQCAAQSAKTQTVINCACWAIAEDPGPAMWVTATKDELRDFMRDRLTPTFETCRPVTPRARVWPPADRAGAGVSHPRHSALGTNNKCGRLYSNCERHTFR